MENLKITIDKILKKITLGLYNPFYIKGIYRFRLTNTETGEVREIIKENLITLGGRNYIIKRLMNDQAIAGMKITHVALGTNTTAPTVNDTQLGAEVYRNAVASATDSVNVGYLTGFFTAVETTGTYKEVGLFIDGTSTANSGTLLSKTAINITKSSVETLTIDYQLTLN